MSYRSRLYNHRNAQTPEAGKKKPFFSSKHGAGAADDKKKFFHAGGGAAPQVQRLATSPIDESFGTTEEKQARNKGDKLRDKPAAGAGAGRGGERVIQRQLAVPPVHPSVEEPLLTPKQIHDAVIFNKNRYGEASIRQIQKIVGVPMTGLMDTATVKKIAHYQAKYGLDVDGMAGESTFINLTDEMAASGAPPEDCINYFNVTVGSLVPSTLVPGTVRIKADVRVDIKFDPHCDCSRLDYRQYVKGNIFRNGVNINTWIDHAPGGGLPGMGHWIEDGDNTLPHNGPYGHREYDQDLGATDHYIDPDGTPNKTHGCVYENSDSMGIDHGTGNRGDIFVFDVRFFGEIRRDRKAIEKKFWAIRGTITI